MKQGFSDFVLNCFTLKNLVGDQQDEILGVVNVLLLEVSFNGLQQNLVICIRFVRSMDEDLKAGFDFKHLSS